MTKAYDALSQLTACLHGAPAHTTDWLAVIKLANETLVTPQLAAELAVTPRNVPDDVRVFLGEVRERNTERNRRLFEQLTEAVGVLNRAGIEPTLLKGASLWATREPNEPYDRLLTDVDILVRPEQAARAVDALADYGFPILARYQGDDVHVVAELARPTDVGMIDLHQRAPGPPGLADSTDFVAHRRKVSWDGVNATVPSPALSVFLTVLHDQFHDGDYWRGSFDLRHLLDIALLAQRTEGVDWDHLFRLCETRLTHNAAATELLAARKIMGGDIPEHFINGPMVRLQHARRMAQFRWPHLRWVLAGLGLLLETPNLATHALENRRGRERVLGSDPVLGGGGGNPFERFERLRHVFAQPDAGKL